MNIPQKRLFWAVALGHAINDTFMSMGPVLLTFISVSILPMSNTQIGLTASVTQLVGAISQPGFGLMADRSGGRWLAAGGVLWTGTFLMLGLLGAQTGYFWVMFFPWIAMAVGSGAFHPSGSMHAAESDPTRTASNMSYFFLMGQLGLAIGPTLGGVILDMTNKSAQPAFIAALDPAVDGWINWAGSITPIFGLWLLVVPIFIFMATTLPTTQHFHGQKVQNGAANSSGLDLSKIPMKGFLILATMVGLRSLAQPGSVTFIPLLFQQKGWSPSEYGAITSSFWLASGFAGIIFGSLADRYDRRKVVALTMALSAPAFFLLPFVNGPVAFAMAIIAGGLSGGSHSIIVVLAQELIPGAKGFASGAILGFIFGMGALGSALIGGLSDAIGLPLTFQIVAGVIVVSALMALWIPARQTAVPGLPLEVEPVKVS